MPFAVLGFVRYHGMSAEQFLWAWIRSELLEPKRLIASRTQNLYYSLMKESAEKRLNTETMKEDGEDVENIQHTAETGS